MSSITFDDDHANATLSGWRYPQFQHEGERSIVLIEEHPKGVLSYVFRSDIPYVLQIQGARGERPPRNWTRHLLGYLVERSDEVIVRSARNNPLAREFHDWLVSNDAYREAGLGDVRFGEALGLGPQARIELDGLVERTLQELIPEEQFTLGPSVVAEEAPHSRLHPSTAYMRYDVTARGVARRLKKRLEEIDQESARAFGVAPADLFISG